MRVAFKMTLVAGKEKEYQARHDEIWPDLCELLKESGISGYSIFLDTETNTLFGFLKAEDEQRYQALATRPIMQQWWDSMKDITVSNPDNSPVAVSLKEVFYLA